MKFVLAFSFMFLLAIGYGFAQSGKDYNPNSQTPSSRDMGTSEASPQMKSKKTFKKKKKKEQEPDRLVREYHERMEANKKKYKKMAKEMEKPQYSDPLYFGHKKKPKKRPVGKRKFCQECGIVH
jgi:hypothetical protein